VQYGIVLYSLVYPERPRTPFPRGGEPALLPRSTHRNQQEKKEIARRKHWLSIPYRLFYSARDPSSQLRRRHCLRMATSWALKANPTPQRLSVCVDALTTYRSPSLACTVRIIFRVVRVVPTLDLDDVTQTRSDPSPIIERSLGLNN
jgi:hypothetical protein